MSYYHYSPGLWPHSRQGRFFIPIDEQIASLLDAVGPGPEPMPAALQDAVRVERRYVWSSDLVVHLGWRATLGTHLVTRLTRLRAGRLRDKGLQISKVDDPDGRHWTIMDDAGTVVSQIDGDEWHLALSLSDDPACRVRGLQWIARRPVLLHRLLHRIEESIAVAAVDGKLYTPAASDWTAEELSTLLNCPDRELRQRARLVVGLAANHRRGEQQPHRAGVNTSRLQTVKRR